MTKWLLVIVGYRELFGEEPTWDILTNKLARYSIKQVLGFVTWCSAVLQKQENVDDYRAQRVICQRLFGIKWNIIWDNFTRFVVERKMRGQSIHATIYHEMPLLNLTKTAFQICSIEKDDKPNDFYALGEAFLMMINIVNDAPLKMLPIDERDELYLDKWSQFLIASGLFNTGDQGLGTLPRAYDLFVLDKSNVGHTNERVDLPGMIRRAKGIEAIQYIAAIVALHSGFAKFTIDNPAECPGKAVATTLFDKFSFTSEEVNRIYEYVSISIEEMQARMRRYPVNEVRPYYFYEFMKWPMVRIENDIYCISQKLLIDKITRGLYHIFIEDCFTKTEIDKSISYIGKVFEEYVDRIFKKLYPESSGKYHFLDESIKCKISGKSCDHVVNNGDSVILLESKATLFPIRAASGEELGQIDDAIKQIYIKSSEQISNTIAAIKAGRLVEYGFMPERIKNYYPVIVTLEHVPMFQIIYRKIMRDIQLAGHLTDVDIMPFQSMSVDEIELLEMAIKEGHCLTDILISKINSEWRGDSFRNYYLSNGYTFIDDENVEQQAIFDAIMKKIIEYFEQKAR